jgi:hypothetical protein
MKMKKIAITDSLDILFSGTFGALSISLWPAEEKNDISTSF